MENPQTKVLRELMEGGACLDPPLCNLGGVVQGTPSWSFGGRKKCFCVAQIAEDKILAKNG